MRLLTAICCLVVCAGLAKADIFEDVLNKTNVHARGFTDAEVGLTPATNHAPHLIKIEEFPAPDFSQFVHVPGVGLVEFPSNATHTEIVEASNRLWMARSSARDATRTFTWEEAIREQNQAQSAAAHRPAAPVEPSSTAANTTNTTLHIHEFGLVNIPPRITLRTLEGITAGLRSALNPGTNTNATLSIEQRLANLEKDVVLLKARSFAAATNDPLLLMSMRQLYQRYVPTGSRGFQITRNIDGVVLELGAGGLWKVDQNDRNLTVRWRIGDDVVILRDEDLLINVDEEENAQAQPIESP